MKISSFMSIFKSMCKFLFKVGLFFLLIVIFDVFFGYTMDSITKRIDIGGTGCDNYICDKMTDDLVVFGSSRAEHHYNTQMMSDSLGYSCYNAGEGGCGIILAYGRLLMILERYTPKTIIYEVTPGFDYLDWKDKENNLSRLKPRYYRPGIDSIFWAVDSNERYKMISGMYRHNSIFLQNSIVYLFRLTTSNGIKGFRPTDGEMDVMKIKEDKKQYDSKEGYMYDTLKIHYLHKFVEITKDLNLLFVVSPMWYGQDTLVLEPIKQICKKKNICLIDYSNSPKYVHRNEYFKDGTHLNARGADEFTKDLIVYLRKRYRLRVE